MRTTLSLDDDVLEIAQRFARGQKISLGKAVSNLVRRSISAPTPTREKNGLTIFDLPADSPKVTAEHVRRLLDEEL